jgi:hypothetical protein
MHAAQTHFGPPVMHDFGLVMDTNMCGHHQTHIHWANGQSWKKEADSSTFVLPAIRTLCRFTVFSSVSTTNA